MRYEALFLDFYGTLVCEDDDVIAKVVKRISTASRQCPEPKEVASFWWATLRSLFETSFLDTYQTQRQLESQSLEAVLKHFDCPLQTDDMAFDLFEYWCKPDIFSDTKTFLAKNPLPICIVSNIDRKDIQKAILHHDFSFPMLVTSEDAKSYKPRTEMFFMALESMGLSPAQVLHIGDSMSSDIAGANNCGIDSFWLNRKGRPLPPDFSPTYCGTSLLDVLKFL